MTTVERIVDAAEITQPDQSFADGRQFGRIIRPWYEQYMIQIRPTENEPKNN